MMLQADIQTEIAVIRYQIKQIKADYEEAMFQGKEFNKLVMIQIELKKLEDKRCSYLEQVEHNTN